MKNNPFLVKFKNASKYSMFKIKFNFTFATFHSNK
jgi:hypothetical protein